MRLILIPASVLAGCQEYELAADLADGSATDPSVSTEPSTPAGVPEIEVDPLTLDFGYLPKDCTSDRQVVTVTNVGGATLDIEDISLTFNDGGAYRIAGPASPLEPGEQLEVQVEFTPPDYGLYSGSTILLTSNDADEGEVHVDLFGEGADSAIHSDQWTQTPANQVDVLWVIDNSGSMSGEIDNLADEFDVFINAFVAMGLDYQIGVVTTDMTNPAQSGRIQGTIIDPTDPDPVAAFNTAVDLGSGGSGDERGMDAAQAALTAPLITNENVGMVRPGSFLSIIEVTDEADGSTVSPTDFASWLEAYQGDPLLTAFSAMSGPSGGLFPCIAFFSGISAEPAPGIFNAIQQTGGIHAEICNMDMSAMLTALASVSAGLQRTFTLSYLPTDPTLIEVVVDGYLIPIDSVDGYLYNAATNQVTLYGMAIPDVNEVVEVTYPLESTCPN